MARPSNTQQRRQEITAALASVMAEKGYDRASIGDVAELAGLTPGLVHYHFHNKLEILVAVVHELGEAHLASLDRALAEARGDALTELDAFIDVHLATGKRADEKRLLCWIAIGAEALREPLVRAPYRDILEQLSSRLERIIQAGQARGRFQSVDARAAAVAILATIQGYFGIAGAARSLIPVHSAAPALKTMARGLLGVRARAGGVRARAARTEGPRR